MESGKTITSSADHPAFDLRPVPVRHSESARAAFEEEVIARLGLFPNTFCAPGEASDAVRILWMFASSAWLDNPLPSLFKERLFVHLSRFCPWRYCLRRHAGFLLGCGRPAGDPVAPRQSVAQVTALLRRPGRLKGAELDAALSRLAAAPGSGIPEPGSRREADMYAAATELFVEPDRADAARNAIITAAGTRNLGLLLTFLAFVRVVHYWTTISRPEPEEDLDSLLRDHEELAGLLLAAPETADVEATRRLTQEVRHLRRERDERAEAARTAEMLRLALDAAGQGAFDYDLVADIPHWDDRTCALFGRPPGSPLTPFQVVKQAVPPQDRARINKAILAATDPGGDGRYEEEFRVVHPGGSTRWVSVSGQTLFEGRDKARRPVRTLGTVRDVTERVQAEERLRKSEERYRTLFNSIDQGFCVIEMIFDAAGRPADFRFLETNAAFERQTGLVDAVGKIMRTLVPGTEEYWFETYGRIVRTGRPERFENLAAMLGRYYEVYAFPTGEPHQHQVGILFNDITERHVAERELRRREARLEAVLSAADLGYWHWNVQADEGEINRRYAEMLGLDFGSFKLNFERFERLIHPADRLRMKKALREHFEGRTGIYGVEIRMRHNDGHWVWVLASGRVIERDGAGRPLVMTGVHLDISSRVEMIEALHEREEQFRLLADNIHQLAWMADATGWIYWYNKRWFDFTGTTLEEMQGWGWRKVHHPDHEQRVVGTIAKCFVSGEAWEDTFPLRGKDGQYRWFLSRALPVRDERGCVVRWFGTSTDITERLRAEQDREFLVNELNHRVKNTLAVVQGIARQTFREGGEKGRAMARAFENRLMALAAAHNLLTNSNWESSSLRELALKSIESACTGEAPVRLDGPPVVLTPKQAITFVMAIHELCTNATKYGALSSGSGRIDIRWAVSNGSGGRRLKLIWREHGGPAVTPPRRRGFGLRMIEQALARELDGRVIMDFRPEGLVCTIEGTLERNGRSTA